MKALSEKSRTVRERIEKLASQRELVYPEAGVLLVLINDIIAEPDSSGDSGYISQWVRIRNFSSAWRGDTIKSGSLVLCLSHTVFDGAGVRSIKFLHNQKTYTLVGYYLPGELFKAAPAPSEDVK